VLLAAHRYKKHREFKTEEELTAENDRLQALSETQADEIEDKKNSSMRFLKPRVEFQSEASASYGRVSVQWKDTCARGCSRPTP
jgi:hypothetical protein